MLLRHKKRKKILIEDYSSDEEIKNSSELEQRGMHLRATEQTFADSLQWMLDAGYLKPEQVPRLIKNKV